MTSNARKAFPLYFYLLVVIAAFSSVAVFAQEWTPATSQGCEDPLPHVASPKPSQEQPREQLEGQSSSSPSQPQILSYGTPGTHVTILENTLIRVMSDQPLSSSQAKEGAAVFFTVSQDVIVNHVLVIPRGATILGEVIETRKAGVVSGSPVLTLKLDTLSLGDNTYPLFTYHFRAQGTSKKKPAATDYEDGAVIGALAGGVVSARTTKGGPTSTSDAKDMAAGAAVGAGVVAVAAVAAPRPVLELPAESQMDFYLASPISVQPVSQEDAEKLSRKLHPGGPVLYVQGDTP